MDKFPITEQGSQRTDIYQILLDGHLSSQWLDWFDGFTLTINERGQSILIGAVADQAALHGLLNKIRDLGIPLISVNLLDHE